MSKDNNSVGQIVHADVHADVQADVQADVHAECVHRIDRPMSGHVTIK